MTSPREAKSTRKYSMDRANTERPAIQKPLFFGDNRIMQDATAGIQARISQGVEPMNVEGLMQKTSDSRCGSLDHDYCTYSQQPSKISGQPGKGESQAGLETDCKDHQDVPLSRTTSSISNCTIALTEIGENSDNQHQDLLRETEEASLRVDLGSPQVKCYQANDTSRQASQADQEQSGRSRGSAFSTVSFGEQNLLLESIFDSMEKSAKEEDCSSFLQADYLKLFEETRSSGPHLQRQLEEAAARYAQAFGGKLVPVKVRFFNTYTFKCCLGHKFDLQSGHIVSGSWCEKCSEMWQVLQKTAKKKDSTVMDSMISPTVNVRCMRSHLFTVKPSE